VVEFGSRRAHGIEAGVLAARAAFIGGCMGTSNTFAAKRFGIHPYGTQAHSWIMAHENEGEAFRDFLEVFPEQSTLLVDTYNVRAAIEKIIALGRKPAGVRLDSGDILADSIWVRDRFDEVGWKDVQIFASGDLDEDRIASFIQGGAKIDAFGVGAALTTSSDSPNIGMIYKLAEMERGGRVRNTAKFSEEKNTYPGRKQVFRSRAVNGIYAGDIIGLEDENFIGAEPLLVPVMQKGRRLEEFEADSASVVQAAQQRFLTARQQLPRSVAMLARADGTYPVRYSERLEELSAELRRSFAGHT
jgi:nicotinate phosphoribosyltransferase